MRADLRRGRHALATVMLLALIAGSATAEALPRSDEQVRAALGRNAELLDDGLYRVTLPDGHVLTTHGPDADAASHGTGIGPGDPERPPACATDNFQHVLYGYPTGKTSRLSSVRATLQASVRRMNAVLNEDSVASGGPSADFKVLCDTAGAIKVDEFTATGSDFELITAGARAAGYTNPNADYTIFWDDTLPGLCGVGSISNDDRLVVDNANNSGGDYAITYSNCWTGGTPMHENGHNQGAVQYDAEYSTGSGWHCWDEIDVMCYAPDGGDKHQTGTVVLCSSREFYDCGWNTYFDSAPEPGEWLASHWNIGSTLNRFIRFGGSTGTGPTASFTASCTNLTCSFTDTSTGTITSRSWNFGDSSTGTGSTVSHTYTAAGSYTVTLRVDEADGDFDTEARTVVPPSTPTITTPSEGSVVTILPASVSGRGPPTGTVTLREGSTALATAVVSAGGSWTTTIALSQGAHAITATAVTPNGTSAASAVRSFTVQPDVTPPPAPVLNGPADGSLTGPPARIAGTAEPRATVLIYEGARLASTTVADAAGAFSKDVNFPEGTHTVAVKARDLAGNTGPSTNTKTFRTDATVPTIAFETGDGSIVLPTAEHAVTGTATDNVALAVVVVEVFSPTNSKIATTVATLGEPDEDGVRSWSAPLQVAPGRYRVAAYAVDSVALRSQSRSIYMVVL